MDAFTQFSAAPSFDPVVIAEIGCNHMGDFNLALKMVSVAAECGAHAVKFQKRSPRECLTPERYCSPYDSLHSFGKTYGEHREFLEFDPGQHERLRDHAKSLGLKYASSVWDETSARQIAKLNPAWIKIPSAHNEDLALLRALRSFYKGPIHASNGMATHEAEVKLINTVRYGLVLYACTSTYPSDFKDVKLLDITRFQAIHGSKLSGVGFSGHHRGVAIDLAAAALGAQFIERHFTLDRTWKGTDQAASIEPSGLRQLCRNLAAIKEAWGNRLGVIASEVPFARKLKRVTK